MPATAPPDNFELLDVSKITWSMYTKKLESFTDEDIVIHFNANMDAMKNMHNMLESAELIANHASVPIYRANIGGVGSGFTGGIAVNFYKMAQDAAQMCVDVLINGKDIE